MTDLHTMLLTLAQAPNEPKEGVVAPRNVEGFRPDFWMPPDYANFGSQVDGPFHFITWVCIFFFVGITIALIYFVWKYWKPAGVVEHQDVPSHHTMLEVTWSGIPLIIVIIMFYVGFKGYMDMAVPPANAQQIDVTAWQWQWGFKYPNGAELPELHVPPDEPIRLLMKSKDVLHAFYVPNFRVKQDVVPGRFSMAWFQARHSGTTDQPEAHRLFCAEYCGTDHSNMISWVYVHPTRASYEAWLAKAGDYGQYPPEVAGDLLTQRLGCQTCHSLVKDEIKTGPSFKGVWGRALRGETKFSDGRTLADIPGYGDDPVVRARNYIQESIYDPATRIVFGIAPGMSTFRGQVDEEKLGYIIAYLQWLEDHDGSPHAEWSALPTDDKSAYMQKYHGGGGGTN